MHIYDYVCNILYPPMQIACVTLDPRAGGAGEEGLFTKRVDNWFRVSNGKIGGIDE